MLPLISAILFTGQKSPDLVLLFDANSHIHIEATETRYRSKVYFFPKGVRLIAKGANQSLELKRVDNTIIVTFLVGDGKADSTSDSLELPIVGDKPFTVSYDPASKHYRLAQ